MSLGQVSRILRSKKALVPLVVILVATSAAFSLSSSILLSIYSVQSGAALGQSQNIVVVSQRGSSTGFSGELPLSLLGTLSGLGGVEAVSPEVFAPSVILGGPVMVRGVDPTSFLQMQQLQTLDGKINNFSSGAIVGKDLAAKYHIHAGSTVSVVGDLGSAGVVDLRVSGIFSSRTLLDSELVAPLWVGQWLRGFAYNSVSLFRLKIDPTLTSASLVAATVSSIVHSAKNTTSTPTFLPGSLLSFLPSASSTSDLQGLSVLVQPSSSGQFLSSEFGLSEDSVWLFSALVFIAMSVALFFSFQESIESARREFQTLRQIGMTLRALVSKLLAVNLILSAIAGLCGWVLSVLILAVVPGLESFQLAFYIVRPFSESGLGLPIALAVPVAEATVATFLLALRLDRGRNASRYWLWESGGNNAAL
ncbi:MAG TPA: ABC transporter permease [Nitrososphaerales archaeon]|nr:ABC transporter permease [Nitrososphaerales archaeon]